MTVMEQIVKAPISFTPYYKKVIWGGDRISAYKGGEQTSDNIGESWEISAIPGRVSTVDGGEYDGLALTDLIERFGAQLLGDRIFKKSNGKFPLLIKLIYARDNLSVQVHPDDKLAMARHNCLGKTEMWYIISAEKDAKIYAGLNKVITPNEYESKVADGTFADVLATHASSPGDVFFIPAGRVHAIGAGNLLAEIQDSSDITYRIFDYNRRDADGNTREIHAELAKDAIDYAVHSDCMPKTPDDSVADAEIANCRHFKVRRVIVDGEADISFDDDSFTVVLCVKGGVELISDSSRTELMCGHTVLLPAVMNEISVKGRGVLLIAQA